MRFNVLLVQDFLRGGIEYSVMTICILRRIPRYMTPDQLGHSKRGAYLRHCSIFRKGMTRSRGNICMRVVRSKVDKTLWL